MKKSFRSFIAFSVLVTLGCVKTTPRAPGGGGSETALGDTYTSKPFARSIALKNNATDNAPENGRMVFQPTVDKYLVSSGPYTYRFDRTGKLDVTFGSSGHIGGYGQFIAAAPSGVFYGVVNRTVRAYSISGVPQTSFGNNGLFSFPNPTDGTLNLRHVLVQADGKVVVVGMERVGDANILVIYRLLTDGKVDTTFGTAGGFRFALPVPSLGNTASYAIVDLNLDLIGNMYVALYGSTNNGTGRFSRILCVNPDGILNTGFGTGGVIQNPIAPGNTNQLVTSIFVNTATSKLFVYGFTTLEGLTFQSFVIARYDLNGMPDVNFGTGGFLRPAIPNAARAGSGILRVANGFFVVSTTNQEISRVAADGTVTGLVNNLPLVANLNFLLDGNNLLYSRSYLAPNGIRLVSVSRLSQDGVVDLSFGTDGTARTLAPGSETLQALTMDTNGKIFLATNAMRANSTSTTDSLVTSLRPQIIRLLEDGYDDMTFGSAGRVQIGEDADPMQSVSSIQVQRDGRILVSGHTPAHRQGVYRFREDGSLDANFGTQGLADIGGGCTTAAFPQRSSALALQTSKVLVAYGKVIPEESGRCLINVTRLNELGAIDTSFASAGAAIVRSNEVNDSRGIHMGIQKSGKIIVAGGKATDATSYSVTIARLQPDGALDTTFGSQGTTVLTLSNLVELGQVYVDFEDRIWLLGQSFNQNKYSATIVVMRPNGEPDLNVGIAGTFNYLAENFPLRLGGIVVDGAGQISIALGRPRDGQGNLAVEVARFNPGFTLDTSFGGTGIATISQGINAYPVAMKLQPDGKLLIGGNVRYFYHMPSTDPLVNRVGDGATILDRGHNDTFVIRIKSNGMLDR